MVSIHAPVWGATSGYISEMIRCGFNPRTRVGCDFISFTSMVRINSFNPRTRVGCDGCGSFDRVSDYVSIHAPVWGATPTISAHCLHAMFQSTHPCGVRLAILALVVILISFNPRTRVGCDSLVWGFLCCLRRFNPRTRVGCDITLTTN